MAIWESHQQPPFNEHLGIRITDWQPGHVELRVQVKPEHYNHIGIPHGGFIATLLDVGCALPGVLTGVDGEMRKALTLSLTINYLAQAGSNDLRVIGRLTTAGNRIYYGAADVFDSQGTVLANASGVFRYLSPRQP